MFRPYFGSFWTWHHRLLTGVAVASVGLVAAASMAQPATEPADKMAAEIVAENQAMADEVTQDLPPLPESMTDEPVRLVLREGFYELDIPADAETGRFLMPVERGGEVEPVPARLTVRGLLSSRDVPAFVQLQLREAGTEADLHPGGRGLLLRDTSLDGSLISGRVDIVQYADFVTHGKTVHLIQFGPEEMTGEPAVTLYVTVDPKLAADGDPATRPAAVKERLTAENIDELIREHNDLFVEHLLPVLRDLGFDEVITAETRRMATQLFLADLPVSEDVATQVDKLVKRLNAEDFGDRLAAQQSLRELGRPAATALARLRRDEEANDALSPEQRSRIDAILADWQTLGPESIEALGQDRQFLSEVAALGDEEDAPLRELARHRLEQLETGDQ